MRLNVGAGYTNMAGFVNVDLSPSMPVQCVGRVQELPFASRTFDAINAVDILEHVTYWETQELLDEWCRVLKPRGELFVQCPDASLIMQWYANGAHTKLTQSAPRALRDDPLRCAAWRLMGGHHDGVYARGDDDWRWNAHYALFSEELLRKQLSRAGFLVLNCETNPFPNLQCTARRKASR